MEPKDRLKRFRDHLNLTIRDVAGSLGISHSVVSDWESGKSPVRKPNALALQALYGVSAEWLLAEEGDMWVSSTGRSSNLVQVPIVEGMPSCGPGGEVQDPGPEAEHYPFPASFIQEVLRQCGAGTATNLFLAEVSGDSMRRTILPGDLVLVNNHLELRTRPRKGALYLVRRSPESAEARVKRVFLASDHKTLILQSDNSAYGQISVPIDGIRLPDLILGQVCWYGRHLHDVVPPQEDW